MTAQNEWNPMAHKFGMLLQGQIPSDDEVRDIRLANAPKKRHDDVMAQEMKINTAEIGDFVPFTHHDTYVDPETGEQVVEEWRRNHKADNQLTKVQINWRTGKVVVFKQVTEAQKNHDRREGRAARGNWIRRDFDLNKPMDIKRALGEAFK